MKVSDLLQTSIALTLHLKCAVKHEYNISYYNKPDMETGQLF